jgi:hypothetical protein
MDNPINASLRILEKGILYILMFRKAGLGFLTGGLICVWAAAAK